MRWKSVIPWILLVCELVVLICLFGMLIMAGISAGFTWWPMPVTLAVRWLFAVGCVFSARQTGRVQRWVLWALALVPVAYLSFFIARDSWQMSNPVTQTWIIPADYHGPIYVVRNIPQATIATVSRDRMVFVLDDAGIAAVKEPIDSRWVRSIYEYRSSSGVTTQIPEAAPGSIDDTPANRQDQTRRIYFPGSGGFADGSGCTYSVSEAYVESPSEALTEQSSLSQAGKHQADVLELLKNRYPAMCSVPK